MKIFSKEGLELMDVKSVHQEGDIIIAKGKVMGSMSVTLAIKPEDCWGIMKLLGFMLCLKLPVLLVKGLLRSCNSGVAAAKK